MGSVVVLPLMLCDMLSLVGGSTGVVVGGAVDIGVGVCVLLVLMYLLMALLLLCMMV